MLIKFRCPNCKQKYESEEEYLGQFIECPNCFHQFTVEKMEEVLTALPVAEPISSSAEIKIKSYSHNKIKIISIASILLIGIICVLGVFLCAVLYAESLEDVIQQAENAIAEKYKTPIAKKSAEKKLLAIIEDTDLTDEQKIEKIKKQIPIVAESQKTSSKTQDRDTETHYELGKNYLENEEYDKAIVWLEKASSNNHKQAKELLKICIAIKQGMRFSKDYKTLVKFEGHNRTECIIPDNVTTIGDSAFSSCKNLQSVVIPNSVTTIGGWAFSYCRNLQSVTIPDSVTIIGEEAFESCDNLQSVTIGNSVKTIGKEAFEECKSLQSVTIGNSVTEIGDGAFWRCSNLQSVVIPDSVTTIGGSAFLECKSLQSVTIGNSVTTIGKGAFGRCDNLQSVTIPNSVTTIGDGAFWECKSLQSVTIPNSVTTIGDAAFLGVKNVNISSTYPYFYKDSAGALISKKDKKLIWFPPEYSGSYTIPNSVITIGVGAFGWCENLQSVTIPNSVTIIGNLAFGECDNLKEVRVPRNCKIGKDAFPDGCRVIRY